MTTSEKKQLTTFINESSNPDLLRLLINKLTKAPNLLLKKYMQHIYNSEYRTYLRDIDIKDSFVDFNKTEIDILRLIESELNG